MRKATVQCKDVTKPDEAKLHRFHAVYDRLLTHHKYRLEASEIIFDAEALKLLTAKKLGQLETLADNAEEAARYSSRKRPAAIQHYLNFFEYKHLPPHLSQVSKLFHDLAYQVVKDKKVRGLEAVTMLRKLLEAKDCAVRAALPAKSKQRTAT